MVIADSEIQNLCAKLHRQEKTIVFTNGCFDILHAGHVRYLQAAKKMGDYLIIGLNTDESVKKLKGQSRPINKQEDRAEVLMALKSVDYVVMFGEPTAESLLKKVLPDIYVKGGDYTVQTLPEAKVIQSYGGKIEFVSLLEGKSSTNIINKIKSTK